MVGLVKRVVRDSLTYYAIQDGGLWHHPHLQAYIGRIVCIRKNCDEQRLELATWQGQVFIAVLAEEVVH